MAKACWARAVQLQKSFVPDPLSTPTGSRQSFTRLFANDAEAASILVLLHFTITQSQIYTLWEMLLRKINVHMSQLLSILLSRRAGWASQFYRTFVFLTLSICCFLYIDIYLLISYSTCTLRAQRVHLKFKFPYICVSIINKCCYRQQKHEQHRQTCNLQKQQRKIHNLGTKVSENK